MPVHWWAFDCHNDVWHGLGWTEESNGFLICHCVGVLPIAMAVNDTGLVGLRILMSS